MVVGYQQHQAIIPKMVSRMITNIRIVMDIKIVLMRISQIMFLEVLSTVNRFQLIPIVIAVVQPHRLIMQILSTVYHSGKRMKTEILMTLFLRLPHVIVIWA